MALLLVNRLIILCLTVNILLQEVNCHVLSESREIFQTDPLWGKVSHAQTQSQRHARLYNGSITGSSRNPKFVNPASVFTMVQFSNAECENSANFLRGTCYTVWDCLTGILTGDLSNTDTNVITAGTCQQGFGICCTSILGCGGFSSNNNTYLRSPGYPDTFQTAIDCDQTIIIEENICQLRMNFEDLTLAAPDSTGTCVNDYLKVNQDRKFEFLCGKTKNNHFYLDVDYWDSPNVIFSFHTDASTQADRSWSIRITKIECDSDEEVPRGCGQYYTGVTNTIKGLNYEATSSEDYQLSGMNYAVCVRMELGYCENTYTEEKTSVYRPTCPDIFEKPGRYKGEPFVDAGIPIRKCVPQGFAIAGLPQSETYQYLNPHQFKMDTTRGTTNTHQNTASQNHGGIYYYDYTQTKCT